MMSDLLRAHIEAALEEVEERLPSILSASSLRLRDLIPLSDALRVAGIGELFATGRSAPLRRRLHQSARVFAHGLAKVSGDDRLASKARPFFDALAAEDMEAASAIARLTRRTWATGREFEEDFLFVEVPMQVVINPFVDLSATLARWEAALNGTEDVRHAVMLALHKRDESAFNASLATYLEQRADQLDEVAANESPLAGALATEHHFCVEGVALAKLARRTGIAIARGYRHVPGSSLEPAAEDWEASDWRTFGISGVG